MAYIQSISSIAFAAIVFLTLSVSAQDATTPTTVKPVTPEVKLSCVDAESMAFDASQMVGEWYEVARHPAPTGTVACVGVNITAIANTTDVEVNVTYANDNKFLWINETVTAKVSVANANQSSKAGYSISFSIGNTSWPTTTYKLVKTDYKNYAIACGYKNATDNSTGFGLILTRLRMLNNTVLSHYNAMASANYSNFVNGSMTAITQNAECLGKSGAISTLPFLSAIMTAIYALLMLVN